VIVPAASEVNLTPTSIDDGSPSSGVGGVMADPQIEHGQETVTLRAVPAIDVAVCRLALSSTARDSIVVVGLPCAGHT
jgi:hypothetical protein